MTLSSINCVGMSSASSQCSPLGSRVTVYSIGASLARMFSWRNARRGAWCQLKPLYFDSTGPRQ